MAWIPSHVQKISNSVMEREYPFPRVKWDWGLGTIHEWRHLQSVVTRPLVSRFILGSRLGRAGPVGLQYCLYVGFPCRESVYCTRATPPSSPQHFQHFFFFHQATMATNWCFPYSIPPSHTAEVAHGNNFLFLDPC
jgi:hypothetical protein